jgi:hypothetical protein
MAAPTQQMKRRDAVMEKSLLYFPLYWFLEEKGSFELDIGLSRTIEVNIFNVEIDQQRFPIPEGTENFQVMLQAGA